jgi:lysophospholipid acyltransferase (LPLAT)-like uncharacterized protein
VLGALLGILVWIWSRTWRIRLYVHSAAALSGKESAVFAFWHGQQMALTGLPRRRETVSMVSLSRDGAIQTGVVRALGMRVVRGSASRGGAEGLRRMVSVLRAGADATFAVDGPRGPLHQAKAGAAWAAEHAEARLVPVGVAVSSSFVLRRTWDRFEVPLPFARVVVCLGAAVQPEPASREPQLLGEAIATAAQYARRVVRGGALTPCWRRHVMPSR